MDSSTFTGPTSCGSWPGRAWSTGRRRSALIGAADARGRSASASRRSSSAAPTRHPRRRTSGRPRQLRVDTNHNAGLDALRGGGLADPTVQVTFASADVPKAVAAATTSGPRSRPRSSSPRSRSPTSFMIRDVNLQLNIQRADQTTRRHLQLKVELVAPDGTHPAVRRPRDHRPAGSAFTDTIFDDPADHSIEQGGPPFTSSFKPRESSWATSTGPIRCWSGMGRWRPASTAAGSRTPTATRGRSIAGR